MSALDGRTVRAASRVEASALQAPGPHWLDLDDPSARDPTVSGSKAACLAIAGGTGIRVLPGLVLTTAAHRRFLDAGQILPADLSESVHTAWARLSERGRLPLVVRSSSTVEDIGTSSMAGRFCSVLDVRGWEAFLVAVTRVFRSAEEIGAGDPSPMGVLVQPMLVPRCGGVLFGVDPVSGNRHVVVEAVAGGPHALVSGQVTAQHYVSTRHGRLIAVDHRPHHLLARSDLPDRLLSNRDVRALARLAAATRKAFGGPQDVEWAIEPGVGLLLLQSRPVTATGNAAQATGPVLGPGPVAETFPDPLSPLEVETWISPLRSAVVAALRETRAVPRRQLACSPVLITVDGRVAADLELFGYVGKPHGWARLNPLPSVRRLGAAWRVGRLRAGLPEAVESLVGEVDDRLAAVDLAESTDSELLGLLDEGARLLHRLHHQEVLAGTLLPRVTRTAAAAALEVLAGRMADDPDELVHRFPLLLSLMPPGIGAPVILPPVQTGHALNAAAERLAPRERLRLRARWVQELTARAAWALGRRLAERGLLDDPASVAMLSRAELEELVMTGRQTDMRDRRALVMSSAFSVPLPAQFRLTERGQVVPAGRWGAKPGAGVGAGGGRGTGAAVHGSVRHPPAPGEVLVVRELHPGLAPWLPDLAGLVAETGGTLSHLAILAREYGIPTVVACHDALLRFPPGARLVVDGSTGEVTVLDPKETP